MVLAQKEKMDLPPYFDSQAQAAAMLGISIYEVKAAKAAGCLAFRGGRIRTKEFQAWLHAPYDYATDDEDDCQPTISAFVDWRKRWRREMLDSLMLYLQAALREKQITAEQFCAIGAETIPLVIELGRVWDAGINEPRYRERWGKKILRKSKSAKLRSRAAVTEAEPCPTA